jgi:23S rRNA pseudouridine1911/1915/1917 synthase
MEYVAGPEDDGLRVDSFLGSRPEIGSRSHAAALAEAGAVTVDGVVRLKSHKISTGGRVVVHLAGPEAGLPLAEDLPIAVVYEDDHLLVVDKPAGMVVHPAPGHATGTLVNALRGRGIAGGDAYRPGIVHRLDRDTSGLLMVAKDPAVHRRLQEMIRRREVERRYIALVHGRPASVSGTIDAPVGRDPQRRVSMAVGGVGARPAVTHFRILEELRDLTLVEARLETGRTHQIRVHFLAIGHPVVGDPVYARRDALGVGRQFLHSAVLGFVHPVTGETLRFESPLPEDLAAALAEARRRAGLG